MPVCVFIVSVILSSVVSNRGFVNQSFIRSECEFTLCLINKVFRSTTHSLCPCGLTTEYVYDLLEDSRWKRFSSVSTPAIEHLFNDCKPGLYCV